MARTGIKTRKQLWPPAVRGRTEGLHLNFAITVYYSLPQGSSLTKRQSSAHDLRLLFLTALFNVPRDSRCYCFRAFQVSQSRRNCLVVRWHWWWWFPVELLFIPAAHALPTGTSAVTTYALESLLVDIAFHHDDGNLVIEKPEIPFDWSWSRSTQLSDTNGNFKRGSLMIAVCIQLAY